MFAYLTGMTRTATLILMALLIASFGSIGCDDDGAGTIVEGSLHVDLGYAEAGFAFSEPVELVESPEDVTPGCAAGGCVIRLNELGEVAEAEIWLDRGIEEGDNGLRTFDVLISREMSSLDLLVRSSDGLETYTSGGSASCQISGINDMSADGAALFLADCELVNGDNETAYLTADLSFTGCVIED